MTFNKTLAYLILLALPLIANATEQPTKPSEPPKAEASAKAWAKATAVSEASSASEANNELNASFRDTKQAPAVLAPSIAPTAPCYYSASGGLSVPGFGASGGKAILDKDCETRERARLFFQFGFTDMAVSLLCGDDPNCPYPNGKPEPPKAQCDEKVERVLQACTAK